jgi:hypothetical protein
MSLFNSTFLCLVSKIEYVDHEILQMYVWLHLFHYIEYYIILMLTMPY